MNQHHTTNQKVRCRMPNFEDCHLANQPGTAFVKTKTQKVQLQGVGWTEFSKECSGRFWKYFCPGR